MMTSDVTTNTHTNTTTENNIPRRRRRRNRRILFRKNRTRNYSFLQRLLLLLLFVSLVFVSVSFNDDDDDFGGSKSSSSSVGIFVRANRVGPRQTPSSRAALKRMSSSSSPQKREKQREIQQKEEKQRAKMKLLAKELEEKKRRKEEDKESAAPSSGTQKRKEEEEVKEEEEMTTTNTRERKEREQPFVEEEKEEEFTSAMMERDLSRRAGSNDDTKEDPDDDEDEAGKVKEALPGSLPSSAEETEDDTTTAETPDTKEDEMKEEMMEQEVAEAQESDALSMGDLGTDSSGGETDDDVSKEEEEEEELTETPNGGERPTTSPEEEQGINDSIITSGEEGDNLDESAVAVEEKSTVDPVAEPELGDAKKEEEEEITSAEEGERIGEKADEKADEQLSKYETLMKEEEEVAKMAEEEEKRSVQAQQQTEEGSVAAEEEKEAPGEIEELPAVNEEKKEEDASPQEPDKVVLDGKSDTHDPLFKGDGKEEERYKEDAPMQEADALSMDFTDDDATATDKVEEEQKKEEEEEKVTVEETPAPVPTDEVIPIEGEEEKVEQEEAPTKKEQEQEKDWDKSQGVYEAILEADKNEETVANAIASAAKGGDRNNTDGNNTTSLTTTTKVLGGIPKSLGVVSASPLTNPTLSFAAFRFSKRLGYAFARPGKCICAGSCECAGACGSSMDSLKKQSTALKEAGVDAGVSVISDASLVYNKDLNLERWIGEVADPAVYGLERLYAAVEYYVSTDVDVEDATIYSIMNKSPYPELAKCDVFDAMFSQLREDRKNGKAVKVNVDAKDEAKLAVLTACDGFVNNPQATKFGGGTSAKEIAERFDAIIPADSGLDGLISLTFMSGFAISDLAYGANDEGSKQNKMRKEMGISVDLATEPDAVLKRLRDTNKVDEELYKQSTTWLDGVKEAHRKAFNAHKAIVEVWIEESDQYCESSTGSSRTCTQDGSSSSTTTDQFAELLGSFPEACKASDPKTRSCVDDWWECEGPGSEGSAFAGQFSKASAAATTTLDATGGEGGSPSSGQGRASAVEALSNFKYKVMYDREHPLNKAAQFGAHHSKKFARGTMNAVNVGAGHAVANFKKIPTGVHAGVAIIFIFSLFGYYTYVQYKSLQPVSSLELNTSSVKVLKSFENKEKALRGISNVPAGELMRDDAFWGGGLSQSEMERGTAGRGSSRVIGGTRRSNRNSAKNRGPMTEEELNFYEDLSD